MKKILGSLAAILLITGAVSAQAQDAPPQDYQTQDAPSADSQQASTSDVSLKLDPGVARVSLVQGEVSTQRGDNGEWVAVTQNTPISQDDRVSTGDKSRAELQLDFANILRMSERSTARMANLSRTQIQVQVGQGLVTYNVLKGSEAAAEIDTPNASIRPQAGEGEYRILVTSDSETRVIVRRGSVEVSTSAGNTRVDQGQMITIAGTDNPQYQATRAPDRDDWDNWNNDRNHRIRSADSWGKTNRYYTGSEDLDGHGVWTEVPDYGQVWTPRVEPGWAPYRAGRWVWEPYYGWTWVSYEPWGWAPYHYGRWFVYGGNWVWWPGPVVGYPGYYPIWSPAYVSFFGFGRGFGVGFGFGSVGWLPIGPCDRFFPWWGRFGGRVNVVNVVNIRNVRGGFEPLHGNRGRQFSNFNDMHTNARVRAGMSSMAGNQFGHGAVPSHQAGFSAASLHQASMMTGKMPVTPSRGSFSSTDRAPGASSIRNSPANSQRFFTSAHANASVGTAMGGGRQNGSRQAGSSSPNTGWHSNQPPPQRSMNGGATSPAGNGANNTAGRNQQAGPTPRNNTSERQFTPPASRPSPSTPQGGQGTQNQRGGWQHFTPPSSGAARPSTPNQQPRQYQPPSQQQRGKSPYGQSAHGQSPNGQSPYGSRGNTSHAYNRPPLNMNKPVVTPRGGTAGSNRGGSPGSGSRGPSNNGGFRAAPPSAGSRGGATSGGFRGAPPSSAPRSAPSGGGSHNSAPRGGSSAPHGGGGSSHSGSGRH